MAVWQHRTPHTCTFSSVRAAVLHSFRAKYHHSNESGVDTLPLVLLGLRTAQKEDLKSSSAELLYCEPLKIPGEFLESTSRGTEPSQVLADLRHHMENLRPKPPLQHGESQVFEHPDLKDTTHVFLRQDGVRRSLQPPYSGPYKVLERTDKTLKLLVCGQEAVVSTDKVKPAYTLAEPTMPPRQSTTPSTRFGCRVRFPDYFQAWLTHSAGGGVAVWQHRTPHTCTFSSRRAAVLHPFRVKYHHS